MQTFFPLPIPQIAVATLDDKRLGKQRVEAYQILEHLVGAAPIISWANHPVNAQWRGYERYLAEYIYIVCQEWRGRGFLDNMIQRTDELIARFRPQDRGTPPWVGNAEYHRSHRSKLLFKGRKDALAKTIRDMIRAEDIRLRRGRRACVEGWLDAQGWSAMRVMNLPEVEALEQRMGDCGYELHRNDYANYQWDVNDRNEIAYVWPTAEVSLTPA